MNRLFFAFIVSAIVALGAAARQPQRGYRGFIDWSNSLRSEEMWYEGNTMSTYYTGFSTSHGYQFNPWIFAGAGLDYEHCSDIDSNLLALYLHSRIDMKYYSLTPFGDIRIGYNVSDGGGVYFSPTIGYRYNWGRKVGVNLGVGLTVQGYTYDEYEILYYDEGWGIGNKIGTRHGSKAYFSFRVGLDF